MRLMKPLMQRMKHSNKKDSTFLALEKSAIFFSCDKNALAFSY